MEILNEILDKGKQYIGTNKSEHPSGILTMTFHKPAGKQMCMSSLDMAHRKFYNKPEDKSQDQLMLIQSIRTDISKRKKTTWKTIYQRYNNNLYWFNYSSRNQE